jgi:hypothetical protein
MRKLAPVFAALLLIAACGQSSDDPAPDEPTAPKVSTPDMPELSGPMSLSQTNALLGKAYLEENKTMPGVKTTASGLQYQIVNAGDASGPNPTPGQIVCVHYRGSFIEGNEFDSSYSRNLPTAFPSNGVIRGWIEALAMMRAGDKWKLVIPSELAYGADGTRDQTIGPNEVLVFDVELLKLLDISMAEYLATYARDYTLDCSKHGE